MLSIKELMLLNCGVSEDSWESLRARISNQSFLKEISPEYLLAGVKLKLQYFGHLLQRTDSLVKTLMLGKIEGRRRRGWQRMRWLDGVTDSKDMSLNKLQELVMGQGGLACCSPRGRKESDMTDWTELNWLINLQTLRVWIRISAVIDKLCKL